MGRLLPSRDTPPGPVEGHFAVCITCLERKPLGEFDESKRNPGHRTKRCKQCAHRAAPDSKREIDKAPRVIAKMMGELMETYKSLEGFDESEPRERYATAIDEAMEKMLQAQIDLANRGNTIAFKAVVEFRYGKDKQVVQHEGLTLEALMQAEPLTLGTDTE